MAIRTSPLAMYDLTLPADRNPYDTVIKFMQTYCKRWCFQLEQGTENGYIHFQCRISLVTKKRKDLMEAWIHTTELKGAHVSPTANPAFYAGNELYVMKDDTRVNGPWSDRTVINTSLFPSHLRRDIEWWSWQQSVLDIMATDPQGEVVRVVLNPEGNIGKSTLASWLSVRNKARRIPIMDSSKDVLRMVMDCPKVPAYFIDFPKAISEKVTKSFIAGIEEVTNGYAYDDRNHFREEYFEKPHVFIFTNVMIDTNLLTGRRWVFYTVRDKALVRIERQEQAFEATYALPVEAQPGGLTLRFVEQAPPIGERVISTYPPDPRRLASPTGLNLKIIR